MKIFVDIPFLNPLRDRVIELAKFAGITVSSTPMISHYIIQVIGETKSVDVDPSKLILLGDFSKPKTIWRNCIAIDYKTGTVQHPLEYRGLNWKYVVDEFIPIPTPA